MGSIYKLTFTNGKSYIGMTMGAASNRFKNHRSNAKRGLPAALYAAWRKYGDPDLIILESYDALDDLCAAERRLIAAHNTLQPHGYNQMDGGQAGYSFSMSPETKAKISATLKGRPSPNKGKIASEETRQKMRDARLGKPGRILSDEARAAISAKLTGRSLSEEHRRNMRGKGHPQSAETRAKISATKKLRARLKAHQTPADILHPANTNGEM